MTPINDTKTINETIHYIYEDGKTVSPDVVGTPVVFTHDGERDEVAGYTPDIDTVPEIKVEPTDSDIDRTVTYKADEQKAKLRFYDDTDHKSVSYTHLRAHETKANLVCRLLLEKKKQ